MSHPLRELARGRNCMVMSEVCNNDRETVVLAHSNMRRLFRCGMGQKPPDWSGAYCCHACHELVDGKTKSDHTPEELEHMLLIGMIKTHKILFEEGILQCPLEE